MSLYRLDSGIRTGPSQAASLALALLTHTKRATWAEFTDQSNMSDEAFVLALAEIRLAPEQVAVLDETARKGILKFIARAPLTTLASCTHCGKWAVVGSKGLPTNCPLTSNCEGKITKGSTAKKIEIDADGNDIPKPGKVAAGDQEDAAPAAPPAEPTLFDETDDAEPDTGQEPVQVKSSPMDEWGF